MIERGPADSRVVSLVPVKGLTEAKSRLAARLSPRARADLILTCLDRVLDALRRSGCVDQIAVVTPAGEVLDRARQAGALVLDERDLGVVEGQNGALERARSAIFGAPLTLAPPATALLVVSADLPFITAADVRAIVASGREDWTVVIAPDRLGEGTNALFLRPPDAIPFRFGPGSRRLHEREAVDRGCRVREYQERGTSFDVDLPGDLEELNLANMTSM